MTGGYASQGTPIGILLADTIAPRVIGDAGNGFSFDFPVRYAVVPEVRSFHREEGREDVREAVLAAARELVFRGGCQAVAAGSSAFAVYQKEIAEAVKVPVLTDTLFMASFAAQMIQPQKKVAILTLNTAFLSTRDCAGYGLDEDRIVIRGMEDQSAFSAAFSGDRDSYDFEALQQEVNQVVRLLCLDEPKIGAILCENSVLSPFAPEINRLTGLPVFDTVNYINWAASGILRGLTSPFKNRLDGGTTRIPPAWGRRPERGREEN